MGKMIYVLTCAVVALQSNYSYIFRNQKNIHLLFVLNRCFAKSLFCVFITVSANNNGRLSPLLDPQFYLTKVKLTLLFYM